MQSVRKARKEVVIQPAWEKKNKNKLCMVRFNYVTIPLHGCGGGGVEIHPKKKKKKKKKAGEKVG